MSFFEKVNAREDVQKLKDQMRNDLGTAKNMGKSLLGGNWWYWVSGITREGRVVLLGPYPNERKAMEEAGDLHDVRIEQLNTKNETEASRQMRQKMRQEGMSTDMAIKPQLHRRGLAMELRRKREREKKERELERELARELRKRQAG